MNLHMIVLALVSRYLLLNCLILAAELLPVWYGHSMEVGEAAGGEDGVGSPHLSSS